MSLNAPKKYNIPCKFYLKGTCRMGDSCPFLHQKASAIISSSSSNSSTSSVVKKTGILSSNKDFSNDSNLRSTASPSSPTNSIFTTMTLEDILAHFNRISQVLLSRKPLLHIIVLFAADQRVRKYSEEIETTFLESGIHCFTQIDHKSQYIKPDHLVEVITNSSAQFLCVIGDRNMKNKTCHAKKNGKLVEMSLDERIKSVFQEWNTNPNYPKNDPIPEKIDNLSKSQLWEILQEFTSLRRISQKLKRLKKISVELKNWKNPSLFAHDPVSAESATSEKDEKMLSKLTNGQNAAIRLHRDISHAQRVVRTIPIDYSNDTMQNGVSVNTLGAVYQDTGMNSDIQIGISEKLKNSLFKELEELLPVVEEFGNELGEIANNSSLWDAYMKELSETHYDEDEDFDEDEDYNEEEEEEEEEDCDEEDDDDDDDSKKNEEAPANFWKCSKCTYHNNLNSSLCEICQTPRSAHEEEEWSVQTSKKSKKAKDKRKTTTTPSTTKKASETATSAKLNQTAAQKVAPSTTPANSATAKKSPKTTASKIEDPATKNSSSSSSVATAPAANATTAKKKTTTSATATKTSENNGSVVVVSETSKASAIASPANNLPFSMPNSSSPSLVESIPQPSLVQQKIDSFGASTISADVTLITSAGMGSAIVSSKEFPQLGQTVASQSKNKKKKKKGGKTKNEPAAPSKNQTQTASTFQELSSFEEPKPSISSAVTSAPTLEKDRIVNNNSNATQNGNAVVQQATAPNGMPSQNAAMQKTTDLLQRIPVRQTGNAPSSLQNQFASAFTELDILQQKPAQQPQQILKQNSNEMGSNTGFGLSNQQNDQNMKQSPFNLAPLVTNSMNPNMQQATQMNPGQVQPISQLQQRTEQAQSASSFFSTEFSPFFNSPFFNSTPNPSNWGSMFYGQPQQQPSNGFSMNQTQNLQQKDPENGRFNSNSHFFPVNNISSHWDTAGTSSSYFGASNAGSKLQNSAPQNNSSSSLNWNNPIESTFGNFNTSQKSMLLEGKILEDEISKKQSSSNNPITSQTNEIKESSNNVSAPTSLAPISSPAYVNQPCVACGKESTLECDQCAKLRRRGIPVPPTFFCSTECQMKVWKQHHQEVHLKYK